MSSSPPEAKMAEAVPDQQQQQQLRAEAEQHLANLLNMFTVGVESANLLFDKKCPQAARYRALLLGRNAEEAKASYNDLFAARIESELPYSCLKIDAHHSTVQTKDPAGFNPQQIINKLRVVSQVILKSYPKEFGRACEHDGQTMSDTVVKALFGINNNNSKISKNTDPVRFHELDLSYATTRKLFDACFERWKVSGKMDEEMAVQAYKQVVIDGKPLSESKAPILVNAAFNSSKAATLDQGQEEDGPSSISDLKPSAKRGRGTKSAVLPEESPSKKNKSMVTSQFVYTLVYTEGGPGSNKSPGSDVIVGLYSSPKSAIKYAKLAFEEKSGGSYKNGKFTKTNKTLEKTVDNTKTISEGGGILLLQKDLQGSWKQMSVEKRELDTVCV